MTNRNGAHPSWMRPVCLGSESAVGSTSGQRVRRVDVSYGTTLRRCAMSASISAISRGTVLIRSSPCSVTM